MLICRRELSIGERWYGVNWGEKGGIGGIKKEAMEGGIGDTAVIPPSTTN